MQADPAAAGKQVPMVQSFVPGPPRLELKDRLNPSLWRVWFQRWNAFAAVSGLSTRSDKYQTGMLTSAVNDETLRIINTLPYASEADIKKLSKTLELREK